MQPKSNKFLIPVYYTDTIIYKFNSPLLTLRISYANPSCFRIYKYRPVFIIKLWRASFSNIHFRIQYFK